MKYIEIKTKLITQLHCNHPQVKRIWEYGGASTVPTDGSPKRIIGIMLNDGDCKYFEDDGNGDAVERAEEYLQLLPSQN
jgi:hypothetical protein